MLTILLSLFNHIIIKTHDTLVTFIKDTTPTASTTSETSTSLQTSTTEEVASTEQETESKRFIMIEVTGLKVISEPYR